VGGLPLPVAVQVRVHTLYSNHKSGRVYVRSVPRSWLSSEVIGCARYKININQKFLRMDLSSVGPIFRFIFANGCRTLGERPIAVLIALNRKKVAWMLRKGYRMTSKGWVLATDLVFGPEGYTQVSKTIALPLPSGANHTSGSPLSAIIFRDASASCLWFWNLHHVVRVLIIITLLLLFCKLFIKLLDFLMQISRETGLDFVELLFPSDGRRRRNRGLSD